MIEIKKEKDYIEKPSRKKPIFLVSNQLRNYLTDYGREINLPATYEDLRRFTYTVPIKGKDGKDIINSKMFQAGEVQGEEI